MLKDSSKKIKNEPQIFSFTCAPTEQTWDNLNKKRTM